MNFRFSDFSLPSDEYHILSGWDEGFAFYYSADSAEYLTLSDCNLSGGELNIGKTYDGSTMYGKGTVGLTNNLFDRVCVNLDPDWIDFSFWNYNGNGDPTLYVDLSLYSFNNLFRGGSWFHIGPIFSSGGNWVFEDNLFDKVDIVQNMLWVSQPFDYDFNAYWPLTADELAADYNSYPFIDYANEATFSPTTTGDGFVDGGNEKVLATAPPYQAGPLGNYYLPTSTPLYNAGSRTGCRCRSCAIHHPNQPVQRRRPSGHWLALCGYEQFDQHGTLWTLMAIAFLIMLKMPMETAILIRVRRQIGSTLFQQLIRRLGKQSQMVIAQFMMMWIWMVTA